MQGNVSKSKGFKGDDGSTPDISFRYDPETGNLYYTIQGVYIDKDYISTHNLADKNYVNKAVSKILSSIPPVRAFVTIAANKWVAEDVYDSNNNIIGCRYGQRVEVINAVITPNSKVDLQVNSEQMVIFHEKDLAFVAENDGGVITIYCIGSVPQNDYTIQVTVTEVATNE